MKYIVMLFMMAFLTACGEVSGYYVNGAVEGCKTHGGVNKIEYMFDIGRAKCQDGFVVHNVHRYVGGSGAQ